MAKCLLCERGFPLQEGMHVPTQSLGMIPPTLCGKLVKRGTLKAFREYLNAKYEAGTKHRHEAYHQRTRGYGDYLYHQDRDKFDVELGEALTGTSHKDFNAIDSATKT